MRDLPSLAMSTSTSKPTPGAPPSDRIQDYVTAAREYVRRAVGLELDGSVESLAYVDHYLSRVGDVADDVLALIAPALGAYFGEVVIGRLGGRWELGATGEGGEDDVTDATTWRVMLDPAPLGFSPAAMVVEAVRHAYVEGWDASLAVPAEVEDALFQALEAAGPVEEDYYYSLTGRFETIEHAVEILVELGRLRRHPGGPTAALQGDGSDGEGADGEGGGGTGEA